MTSSYIASQEAERLAGVARQQRLWGALKAVRTAPDEALPPEPMMQVVGSATRRHFIGAMDSLFPELVIRGGVEPTSRVLDLGCGCGRFALPFAHYLDGGRYDGVDVWADGVAWCQANVRPEDPDFNFHLKNLEDNYYFNDEKTGVENRISIAFIESDTVDFAFAISLLTHLRPADASQYLVELGRVLKPGKGLAYLTAFIIDQFFFDYVAETGAHKAVERKADGYYSAYSGQDVFAGYSPTRWGSLLADAGLRVVCRETGSWARKPGARLYQDTFVVQSDR